MGYLVVINEVKCFPGGSVVKYLSAKAGDARDTGSIPGQGNGNSLQYFFPENSMDRRACLAGYSPKRLQKSQTGLSG